MTIEEGAAGEFGVEEVDGDLTFGGAELDEVLFVCEFGEEAFHGGGRGVLERGEVGGGCGGFVRGDFLPKLFHASLSEFGHIEAGHGIAFVVSKVGFVFHHVEFSIEFGK